METFPLIGAQLVKKHLKYSELIPAVMQALKEYSQNTSSQPLRTSVKVAKANGTLLTMPCYSVSDDTLVTKLVGLYPDNPEANNLPTIHSYVMSFDPDTGILRCMMDGETITNMRTAAASVAATQDKPKILAIVGYGAQARSHIEAFTETYNFDKIKVWGRNYDKAQMMCNEYSHLPMQNCSLIENAVKDADVIVTVTHASEPILYGKWLKKGSHVASVGACLPSSRECDDDCLQNATVYVDSRESAINESGDIILSKTEIYAEVGEILLKKKSLQSKGRTFFKSLGIALEDAVAVNLVWKNLQSANQ